MIIPYVFPSRSKTQYSLILWEFINGYWYHFGSANHVLDNMKSTELDIVKYESCSISQFFFLVLLNFWKVTVQSEYMFFPLKAFSEG